MFFVLLLLFCVQAAIAGPQSKRQSTCNSDIRDGRRYFLCNNQGLIAFPKISIENIQVLNLASNPLRVLDAFVFNSWSDLEELYLRNTSLVSVNRNAFNSLTNLRKLDLSHNQLRLPDNLASDSLPISLRYLDLSHNPLGVLRDAYFNRLKQLEVLRINNGKIHTVTPTALIGLRSLQTLYLYNNDLTSLPKEYTLFALRSMTNLKLFLLGGRTNRWRCDCELQWLKLWRLENSQINVTIITQTERGIKEFGPECESPPAMQGQLLFNSSIPPESFECPVEVKPSFEVKVRRRPLGSEAIVFIAIAGVWILAICTVVGVICLRLGQSCAPKTESFSTTEPNLGSNLPQLRACVTAMEEEAERKQDAVHDKEEACKEDAVEEEAGAHLSISYV